MLIICPIAGIGGYDSPFTISKPKAMMKIAGKFIIDHLMEKIQSTFPKNTKICFIVGYKKKIISEYLTEKYSSAFQIFYCEQKPAGYRDDLPFFSGLGDAIALAEKHGTNDDCCILLGDMFPSDNFESLFEKFNTPDMDGSEWDGVINVQEVPDPEHYGICFVEADDKIINVVEKPQHTTSNIAIAGAYLIRKTISAQMFEYLRQQAEDPSLKSKFHDFTTIIQQLLRDGAKFRINRLEEPLFDFGHVNHLLEGNARLLGQSIQPGSGCESVETSDNIQNSTIIKPVFIGEDVVITNSVIGPNVSIGDGSVLTRSILSDAVIGDKTTLDGVTTEHSVIGDYVTLEGMVKNHLVIGDSSTLGMLKE